MAGKELHPSVKQFKAFVKENPNLIREVRSGKTTWQELYEEWYLLGEDDSRWNEYREQETEKKSTSDEGKTGDFLGKIMNTVKNMDPDQVQGHINQLSQAIGAIQGVLSQFQGTNQESNKTNSANNDAPRHPFLFRKD